MNIKSSLLCLAKKYWPLIAIAVIIILGVHVRTLDYRWPYLRNIDSYNFFSEMEDIVKNGGLLSNLDEFKLAPYGSLRSGNVWSYFGAYSFMLYSMIFPSTQLWQFMIWFPAFAISLMAIPMYLLGKHLYDRKAGVIAAALIVFDTTIVSRSLGGDPDNDSIVLLMPLLVLSAFLITYSYVQKNGFNKKASIYSATTGIFFAAWVFSWGGYWYIAWMMIGFTMLVMLSKIVSYRNAMRALRDMRGHLLGLITTFAVGFALVMPVLGINAITGTIQGPFQFKDIKAETGQFPNVYVSVAELQASAGPKEVIQRIGPSFFVMLAALSYLLYSLARKRRHLETIILLGIWFVGPFLATIAAVRFSILFSAPIALGSGIIFSKIARMITGEDQRFED